MCQALFQCLNCNNNEQNKISCPHRTYLLVRETDKKRDKVGKKYSMLIAISVIQKKVKDREIKYWVDSGVGNFSCGQQKCVSALFE